MLERHAWEGHAIENFKGTNVLNKKGENGVQTWLLDLSWKMRPVFQPGEREREEKRKEKEIKISQGVKTRTGRRINTMTRIEEGKPYLQRS